MRRGRIYDGEGKLYDMATSLVNYLLNRKSKEFNFGDWLASLTDDELHRLLLLAEAAEYQGNNAVAHLAHIAGIALGVELGSCAVTLEPEKIDSVGMLASCESLQRKGYIVLLRPLRLSGEGINYNFTPDAIEAGVLMMDPMVRH